MMKLLFVASNPADAGNLMLAKEIEELRSALKRGGSDVLVEFREHVPHHELPMLLYEERPDCLHISAHGMTDSILIADMDGLRVKLTPESLATYVSRHRPRLIFLNACDSAEVARGLMGTVDFAIGCATPIMNYIARHGALIFYQLVLAGETVQEAFDVCRAHLRTASNGAYDMHLYHRPGLDSARERLNPPMELIARFEGQPNPDGRQEVSLGVAGCSDTTLQAVFFTDDERFLPDFNAPLEPALCQVARRAPSNGEIWAAVPWRLNSDVQIHCACSGHGTARVASARLTEALRRYYDARGGIAHWSIAYADIRALELTVLGRATQIF
jgi:hypothetical protein